MSERKLFICGSCHQYWSSEKADVPCPSCGGTVYPVDVDYQKYTSWTEEEKKAFKQEYAATHTFVVKAAKTGAAPSADADTDVWISSLNTALNIALGIFVLLAMILFFVGLAEETGVMLTFVAPMLLCIVGFLMVACMKVFIGMAKDLKAIRKKPDV